MMYAGLFADDNYKDKVSGMNHADLLYELSILAEAATWKAESVAKYADGEPDGGDTVLDYRLDADELYRIASRMSFVLESINSI